MIFFSFKKWASLFLSKHRLQSSPYFWACHILERVSDWTRENYELDWGECFSCHPSISRGEKRETVLQSNANVSYCNSNTAAVKTFYSRSVRWKRCRFPLVWLFFLVLELRRWRKDFKRKWPSFVYSKVLFCIYSNIKPLPGYDLNIKTKN